MKSHETGYKIAQKLGKPAANTYKALELLQKKGLVVSDVSSKVKRYSSLPISEYLDQRENELIDKRKKLVDALRSISTNPLEEGLYRLQNTESMYERAKQMILQAKDVVAVDICPTPLDKLQGTLENAAKTKAPVLAKVYSAIIPKGCDVVRAEFIGSPLESWPFEWLQLIIDGKEHLTALIGNQGSHLFQAIWCKNAFLSMVAYNGLLSEFLLTLVIEGLHQKEEGSKVPARWKRYQVLTQKQLPSVSDFIRKLQL